MSNWIVAAAARLFLASSLVTATASPLLAQNGQPSVGTAPAVQQPQQPTTPPNPATSPTPNPAQNPGQTGSGQIPPLSRPVPERTVGLEPGKVVRWTMRDAIMAALDKNADIEIERENVK